ncbi:hypothetical protein TU79_02925 [Pseudomonas trivialis]|uniref:Uncharacterized protein n=1 Tax=Pseudomonas trivialis TaxID=200450 RepID=A0A0R2ZRD5_9PSED|nr:hypothetical protein TU79_02925 [Pseudomonas trivialis]
MSATALEITEACSTGRELECTKATYIEGAKLVGAVGGSYWGGMVLVEDVEKIPLHLKYWMVVPTLVTYLSFAGMFISWLFITD